MDIKKLTNPIKEYSWGSVEAIPDLLGIPKDGKPKAELWMGAHHSAPSIIIEEDGSRESLENLIKKNPDFFLGPYAVKEFNNELPFLFKLLAVEKPLSIQAHPDKNMAESGFADEKLKNIPLNAFHRNYRDSNHKPELICALTPFYAMCGFRDINKIIKDFLVVDYDLLKKPLTILKNGPGEESLKDFFELLMHLNNIEKQDLINNILLKSKSLSPCQNFWIEHINKEYPGDIGAACPLLLNIVLLKPGDALFLSAGVLHSYLQGFGVEIMANSDNVIRGGLTKKHIDISELIKVLNFSTLDVEKLVPEISSNHEKIYPISAKEFSLSEIILFSGEKFESPKDHSFEIIICVKGEINIFNENNNLSIFKGESAIIPFSVKEYSLKGEGRVFKAGIP